MMKTLQECKDEVASNNNFDSFDRAIRYTFNRELLFSEKEFIDKLIKEASEIYANDKRKAFAKFIGKNQNNLKYIDWKDEWTGLNKSMSFTHDQLLEIFNNQENK